MRFNPKICILLALTVAGASYSVPVPSDESCGFYLDFEKETGCWFRKEKDSDYLVRYGYKFCSLFKNAADDWTDARRDWTRRTTVCLQQALLLEKEPINCLLLEEHAFAAHPGCYEKAGFCGLTKLQKSSVVMVATGIDVLLRPGNSLKQAFKLWGDCIRDVLPQVTVMFQRASELATSNGDRSDLASLFWVSDIPSDKLQDYLQFASTKLLGVDSGASKKGIDAYAAIYGRRPPTDSMIREAIQVHCIREGQIVDTPECKRAFFLAGSKDAFLAMSSIPPTIDAHVIHEILAYKEKLATKAHHHK